MFALYFLIIIGAILLWFMFSGLYKFFGKIIVKKAEKFMNEIKEEKESEEKDNE